MANTTTTTTRATVSEVLADYDLHHSADTPRANDEQQQNTSISTSSSNPPDWDTQHRRIPPYRPINRHLDQSQRNVYQNGGERVFITVLFAGVFINASAAQLWRNTVGRVNDSIFKYPLGGQI